MKDEITMKEMFGLLSRAHPWHGVSPGPKAPRVVTTYIEIVPTDAVKYELDKTSGILRIDRPQRFSSMCPTMYGFIPQTLCGEKVAEYCGKLIGRNDIEGDGDPIDVCVLTERPIVHGDILVDAKPIGGLRMIDGQQADDKIIAVLDLDAVYGQFETMADCPASLIERLKHYFLSYKQPPNEVASTVEIVAVYDREEACTIIEQSMEDYRTHYGELLKQSSNIKFSLQSTSKL